MEQDFRNVTSGQNHFAALIAASKRFFRRGNRSDCARSIIVPPVAEYQTSSDRENIYQDSDPPTPDWGC
jgi:hypothetical protein